MTETEALVQRIRTATETGCCPHCGASLVFEFDFTVGWSYVCPCCSWSCGGSV